MVMTPLPPPRTPEEAKKLTEYLLWQLKFYRIMGRILTAASIILAITVIFIALRIIQT